MLVRPPLLFWLLIVVSLGLMGAGAWIVWGGAERRSTEQPAPAPDFALASTDGRQVRLSDLRGQTVLVNFWATWCPPCKAEMPDLQALQTRYGVERNFVVLAVNIEERPETVRAFGQQLGLTFPVLLDADGTVSNGAYGVRSLPTSIIIDASGAIRDRWTGQISSDTMLERLKRVW